MLLPACATPTIVQTSAADTAKAIGHVEPSPKDTCETQRRVAAQSSRIDTTITGKEVVYKADCPKPAKVS